MESTWDYKEILQESAESWNETKGGTIGKPKGDPYENQRGNQRKHKGEPEGKPLERPVEPHWKIRGKLMDGVWDCQEIPKESENMGRKTKGETIGKPLGNHRESGGTIQENNGTPKDNLNGKHMRVQRNPGGICRKLKENQSGNHRKTKRGDIGKTKGGPEGKPLEKTLGHHLKIKRKLMESMWDCKEVLKESEEY